MKSFYLYILLIVGLPDTIRAQSSSTSTADNRAAQEVGYLTSLVTLTKAQADTLQMRLVPFYQSYINVDLRAVRANNRSLSTLQQMNSQHREILLTVLTTSQRFKYDSVNLIRQQLAITRRDSL